MAISKAAIEDFLDRIPDPLPDVKRMEEDRLLSMIRRDTGEIPRFVTAPRAPQLEGLAAALHARRFLALYDMRMGKTHLALNWASHLAMSEMWTRGKGIVIVPVPVLLDVWESQAVMHSVLTTRTVASTSIDEMMDALEGDEDLVLVSKTALQTMLSIKRKNRKGRWQLYPDNAKIDVISAYLSLVIIDEIHGAKNHLSLTFQILAGLVKSAEFRVGLTGTPWGRNPLDIWSQAFLIDGGVTLGRNFYFFEQAFGKKAVNYEAGGRKEFIFDKDKLPILTQKLASISLSYRRADQGAGVFPGSIDLTMRADQVEAYRKAIKAMIELPTGERNEIKNIFIRLRQISSGYLPFTDEEGEDRVVHFQANAKLEWIRDFLSEIGPDISFVIFYEFTPTGTMIEAALTKAKISHRWLAGATKDKAGAVADFRAGKAQCLLANSQSGNVGIDLSIADYQLFAESPISPVIRLQAEQRAQGASRNGRALYIDDMICSPVERKIMGFVREGKETLDELYKDHRKFARSLQI